MTEITTEYNGYKIVTGQYLHYNSYYYEIFDSEGKKIVDTLWTDDASWNSHEDALKKAKWDIDNPNEPASYLSNNSIILFDKTN